MFRKPDSIELTQIRRAFNKWGVFDALKDKPVLVKSVGSEKQIFLVSDDKMVSDVISTQPVTAGLPLGILKKQFLPSLQGASLFSRVSDNFAYVMVNEVAENLVLYGRDILGESVVEVSSKLNQNELVIIINTKRECLGIGQTRFKRDLLCQKGKATVTTIIDAGSYLRDQETSHE
jgi:ribosome biogenesis protein Nip4